MSAPAISHDGTSQLDSTDRMNTMDSSKAGSAIRMGRMALLALVAAVAFLMVVATQSKAADFGVQPGTFAPELVGPNANQAGADANLVFGWMMNVHDPGNLHTVAGTMRDVHVDLPEGLVANPTKFPTCSLGRVNLSVSTCPRESAVGILQVRLTQLGGNPPGPAALNPLLATRIYRVPTIGDEAAAFASRAFNSFMVRMSATATPDRGYRIRVSTERLYEASPILETLITLWGNPAEFQGPGPYGLPTGPFGGPMSADTPRERFLSVPTRCDGDAPALDLTLDPWGTPYYSRFHTSEDLDMPQGCENLDFNPTIEVEPEHTRAAEPAGYDVTLEVPQNEDAVDGLETPLLKDAVVTLPEGVSISPGQVDGLKSCIDNQFGVSQNTTPSCPPASKIGQIKIDSPVLDDPLRGNVFIGQQIGQDPESGQMYRIFVATRAPGVRVKFLGNVAADKDTGQLTTSFTDNPELPFTKLTLSLKGGPRGVLANPSTCGTKTAEATLTPYSAPDTPAAEISDSFEITSGPDASGCVANEAERPFNPKLRAGVQDPVAGASTPFIFRLTRTDQEQEILSTTVNPPAGLTAKLAGIPYCSEADIQSNSCTEQSRIGTEIAGAGAGSNPFYTSQHPGKVYLAGPYKGAPLSMVIQEPVIAGPFDLADISVRAQIHVDPRTAQLTVISDEIPQINSGVPLRVRDLQIKMDRPDFTIAPTNCDPMSVGAEAQGSHGATANLTNRFQVGECSSLGFSPKLNLSFGNNKQNTKPNAHPPLNAKLSFNQGDSNISRVEVALPQGLLLDQERLGRICSRANYAANTCPEESRVGYAKATTPLLDDPVEGPVYLKASDNPLPDLAADLDGQIDIDLFGKIDQKTNKKGLNQIRNTFDVVPDVPVSSFQLTLDGGSDGLLVNSRNICNSKSAQKLSIEIEAHNNMSLSEKPLIGSACKQINKQKTKQLKSKAKKLLAKAKATNNKQKAKALRKQAKKLQSQAKKLGR